MIGLAARKESEVQFREEEGGKGFFSPPSTAGMSVKPEGVYGYQSDDLMPCLGSYISPPSY